MAFNLRPGSWRYYHHIVVLCHHALAHLSSRHAIIDIKLLPNYRKCSTRQGSLSRVTFASTSYRAKKRVAHAFLPYLLDLLYIQRFKRQFERKGTEFRRVWRSAKDSGKGPNFGIICTLLVSPPPRPWLPA